MQNFTRPSELVRALQTDPATAAHPIKRAFLCDGEFLTANLAVVEHTGNALHTQPHHDEVVVIVEGEVNFRVGDETRQVRPGDVVFIPRNTLHGPVLDGGDRLVALPALPRLGGGARAQHDQTQRAQLRAAHATGDARS